MSNEKCLFGHYLRKYFRLVKASDFLTDIHITFFAKTFSNCTVTAQLSVCFMHLEECCVKTYSLIHFTITYN